MTSSRKLPQVLYIANSDESRVLVRRLLSGNYVVLETANPLDGLSLAENTRPGLILLDNNLPHITGNETATRLRKIVPDTPIVIISGDLSDGARERALAAGVVGFIPKPIDDDFAAEVEEYFNGKIEKLEQPELHLQAYQQDLAEKFEGTIRQLTSTIERNKHLLQQNEQMFTMLERRHRLLETAARVGQMVTSILDLDDLLKHTVNIICSEFNFYYSGIFLMSEDKKWATLRAGYAAAGRKMMSENYRLPVDNHSMIGNAILKQEAQITSDVAGEESRFKNPFLPKTRSEMALPLVAKFEALGALTVQSENLNAFSESDIASLQVMADHIAIALNNAQLMEQVFNNLIKNAWEALGSTPEPKINIWGGYDDDPNFVLVAVKDNGPGIPKEIQEKIWVSFFTTKGGKGGTGLGLSSAMQIVNQHGGKIMLESEEGNGAMFSVRLPVAKTTKENK